MESPTLDRHALEKLIGTKVNNVDLYLRAFTHKSALKKYKLTESFETLEFMGDSVLSFVITKLLFDKYEEHQEGFLTKARTKLVRGKTLSHIARTMGLHNWVIMDDKGMRNNWNNNDNVLEDVFEALIGAIYLDLGMVTAKRFILNIYNNESIISMDYILIDDNYKDQLMRYCQANKFDLPQYPINYHTNGMFHVTAVINNTPIGSGIAKNKKQAEQIAAYNTLLKLRPVGI